MATTTNFGWTTPNDTDLVKDGASAIRTLGSSIDTSMAGLKGGTTGQVLSKTSNTDMAFTWVAQDDSNAIQNALVDAKGDLIAATANDTPARLAVGNNGETLVADSSTSTGLRYQPTNAAGKNCIINGGMDIWQRGTTITATAYTADRWYVLSGAAATVTRTTAKTTPNSQYMMLMTATTTQQVFALQAIETLNAIYYAGKTVTLSAYAAGLTTTTNLNMALQYSTNADEAVMGTWTGITATGGSPDLTLSSTVTRFSATYVVPSTAKSLRVQIVNNAANITVGQGIYLGDVQLEVGSVATAFSRAGGTIQGELAACQRYYERWSLETSNMAFAGFNASTTNGYHTWHFHTKKRSEPTISVNAAGDFSVRTPGGNITCTAFSTIGTTTDGAWLSTTVASGLGSGNGNFLVNSGVGSFIQASSEL